jgi:hypothetical protein
MAKRRRPTRELLEAADWAGARCIRLAEALRLEALNLGKVKFIDGRGWWLPAEVKTS